MNSEFYSFFGTIFFVERETPFKNEKLDPKTLFLCIENCRLRSYDVFTL